MKMFSRVRLGISTVCFFAMARWCEGGTVLVSNLGQQPGDPSPAFISATVWDAAVFITGNQPVLFHSATVELRGGFAGTFWTTLYSDANGVPGAALPGGLLSGPSNPNGRTTYFASGEIALAPNTQYWLVGSTDEPGTSGQSYGWYMTYSKDYVSDYGWRLPDHLAFTTDAGGTWISTETALIPRPFYMEISGTLIPEPSTVMMGALGAVVALVSGVRRRWKANDESSSKFRVPSSK